MNIKGKTTRLRALEPTDVDILYRWENDLTLWRVSGTLAPFSRHTLSQLISEQQYDIYATRQQRLIIENIEGEVVGAVDLLEFDPQNLRAGVGIIVDESYRLRGFAKDALLALECYAKDILHLHQLHILQVLFLSDLPYMLWFFHLQGRFHFLHRLRWPYLPWRSGHP